MRGIQRAAPSRFNRQRPWNTGSPAFAFAGDDNYLFNFQTAKTVLRSSLRANGSRESAPDDRLREAIHIWRFELEGWIASLRSQ
jgi:hypothetical protein